MNQWSKFWQRPKIHHVQKTNWIIRFIILRLTCPFCWNARRIFTSNDNPEQCWLKWRAYFPPRFCLAYCLDLFPKVNRCQYNLNERTNALRTPLGSLTDPELFPSWSPFLTQRAPLQNALQSPLLSSNQRLGLWIGQRPFILGSKNRPNVLEFCRWISFFRPFWGIVL